MSFLGMGPLEIIVVLVLAFILLGPDRMVDSARFLGRLVREGRKLASEMPRVVMDDDDIKVVNAGETISMTRNADRKPAQKDSDDSQTRHRAEENGPVAFAPASNPAPQGVEEPPSAERDKTQ